MLSLCLEMKLIPISFKKSHTTFCLKIFNSFVGIKLIFKDIYYINITTTLLEKLKADHIFIYLNMYYIIIL